MHASVVNTSIYDAVKISLRNLIFNFDLTKSQLVRKPR